jgi:PKD repeat protein
MKQNIVSQVLKGLELHIYCFAQTLCRSRLEMKKERALENIVLILILCVAALVPLFVVNIQAPLVWRIEEVDTTWWVGEHTSIALDSMDNPHISYQNNYYLDLKYVWWNGTDWDEETVDSTDDVGYYTSIALDSYDRPHISYYDSTNHDLKYARLTPTGWIIETIDSAGDVGMYSSIALDSNDYPHISYYNATGNDLKYARYMKPPGEWQFTTVDSTGYAGLCSSLALDPDDNPHISYYNGSAVKYAKKIGMALWSIAEVDSVSILLGFDQQGSSIVLDSAGNPHISYCDMRMYYPDLKYARWDGADWQVEIVPEPFGDWNLGTYNSLALDSNDYPHVSCYDDTYDTLWYAAWNGTHWNTDHILEYYTDVGRWSSIVIDSNDNPHISCYYDIQGPEPWIRGWLLYATTAPSNQPPVADADGPYFGIEGESIIFDGSSSYDPDGTLIGFEWDFGDGEKGTGVSPTHTYVQDGVYPVELTVTDNRGTPDTDSTTATISDIEPVAQFSGTPRSGNPPLTASFIDLSTSYDGIASWLWNFGDGDSSTEQNPTHIYTEAGIYDVSLTVQEADADSDTEVKEDYITVHIFNITTVDPGIIFDVGMFTSIAVDSSDKPHISYYESTGANLKYAWWTGTGWGIEIVDSTGDVGQYCSIALGEKDYPHISYYDKTNGDLKYAKLTGTAWSIETVDSTGDVGSCCSIAVDPFGYPHISYNGSGLKYAHWTGTAWSIETVDSAAGAGGYTAITLDSSDRPHISYCDEEAKSVKYATLTHTGWNIETVDSGVFGKDTSIDLDSYNRPHISYYNDLASDDLMYAAKIGTPWMTEIVDSVGDVGRYTSIALDSFGNSQITYFDATNGDLKYARQIGSATWMIERLDSNGDVGLYTSLALDSYDRPHISYYNATGGYLKYATLPVIRDLAVVDATTEKSIVGLGYDFSISVTIENQGTYTESFLVTVYADATPIGSSSVITLARGTSVTVDIVGSTLSLAYGDYTINAYVAPAPGEIDTGDNLLPNGGIIVTIPGDVNGDHIVDSYDLFDLGKAYGSNPKEPNWNSHADINNEGIVDSADLAILDDNYGESWI